MDLPDRKIAHFTVIWMVAFLEVPLEEKASS